MCCMQVRPLNADYTTDLAKDGEFFGIAAKNPILFTTILVPLPLTAVLALETWKRLDVASGWISVIYYLTGKFLVWHDSLRIRCVRLQQRYALLLRFFVSYCFLYCIWLFLAS